jgi:hypothetical protein
MNGTSSLESGPHYCFDGDRHSNRAKQDREVRARSTRTLEITAAWCFEPVQLVGGGGARRTSDGPVHAKHEPLVLRYVSWFAALASPITSANPIFKRAITIGFDFVLRDNLSAPAM